MITLSKDEGTQVHLRMWIAQIVILVFPHVYLRSTRIWWCQLMKHLLCHYHRKRFVAWSNYRFSYCNVIFFPCVEVYRSIWIILLLLQSWDHFRHITQLTGFNLDTMWAYYAIARGVREGGSFVLALCLCTDDEFAFGISPRWLSLNIHGHYNRFTPKFKTTNFLS